MFKIIIILFIGLTTISCSQKDEPSSPSSKILKKSTSSSDTTNIDASTSDTDQKINEEVQGDDSADQLKETVQEQTTKEEKKQESWKEVHSPAVSASAAPSESDEITWDEESIGYSVEQFNSILDSLSGLYMKSVFTNNGNIIKKIKIELVYDKSNELFKMGLEYNKNTVCSAPIPIYSLNTSILSLSQDKAAGFIEDGQWSVTLAWPEYMHLYVPQNNLEDRFYGVKVNTMKIKIKEDYKFFKSNIFSVDPSSLQIDIDPIEGMVESDQWTFVHNETAAYDNFYPIECL